MSQKTEQTIAPATSLQDIISHAKEYGFVFPSSEIYDGLQAVYDYGQNGVELKNNLKALKGRNSPAQVAGLCEKCGNNIYDPSEIFFFETSPIVWV